MTIHVLVKNNKIEHYISHLKNIKFFFLTIFI